jgi:hypothetical protein
MRKVIALALTASALTLATPASSASLILPDGKAVSLEVDSPLTFTVDLFATQGDQPQGAAARIVFNYLGTTSFNRYDFTFSADNTSTAPSPLARLVSFGFDAENPTSITEVSPFTAATNTNGNFNGLGQVDVCFYSGPNCNGNGGAGVGISDTPFTGAFSLNYTSGVTPPLVLENFRARWQSTGSAGTGSASGAGMMSAVPEPTTWAMMLVGFGTVGYSMRRRKAANKILQLA